MKRNKFATDSGFRLIRAFSIEHNAMRFRKHVERLGRAPTARRRNARVRMKARRARRAAA